MSKAKKESALGLLEAFIDTPNGVPTWIYQHALYDPIGNVVTYTDGTQCLICYKAVKGRKARHEKDCAWVRSRRFLSQQRRGK